MAPIAAGLAVAFGYALDAFDGGRRRRRLRLPPPIGHQCNTLVLGPGDYRFGDHWRLGLPLSIIVVVVGTPLIALFWRSEEHTSELQSLMRISYAVFCLKQKHHTHTPH